ncbi:hypothetical protein Unana1_08336 [Umbelopsis nana]
MLNKTILVTAATGKIGKYLVPLLLERQYTVHVLVRSPDSPGAQRLEAIGAKLFKGDFDDYDSIKAAAAGANGVFVNVLPVFGTKREADHVRNIVNASKEAGVSIAVYISGSIIDIREQFPNYGPSHHSYWISEGKADSEAIIKQAGFKYWAILRPVAFMDNFFSYLASFQWPYLYKERTLVTTLRPTTPYPLVDPLDIAAFGEGAFTQPELFHGQAIALASQEFTVDQIASEMTNGIGIEIKAKYVTKDEAVNLGMSPMITSWWDNLNASDHHVNINALDKYPVKLHTFADYLKRNKDVIIPLLKQ